MQRVGRLILLEMDPREPVGRDVPHLLVHVGLEHGLDRAPGAVVHAIVELERADRELRGLDVVLERVERGLVDAVVPGDLGVEALERVEVVALEGVVERLSEMEIAQIQALGPEHDLVHGRARDRGHEHRGAERNRPGQCSRQDGLPALRAGCWRLRRRPA